MEHSAKEEKGLKKTCYKFVFINSFALLQSSCFNFYVHFRSFYSTLFTQMPSLYRYEEIKCENCGPQTTKLNLARHKNSCSADTLHCTQCPNFFTTLQNDLNHHIAKKHRAPKPDVIFKCKLCHQKFPVFYALRQHKNAQHGKEIRFGASNIDVNDIVGDVDDHSLREELESCKHFLTDPEMENGRHRVFNFAMSPLHIFRSTTKWILYSKNWNVLQKLSLHLDSFWKTLRMEGVDTFTLTRTTLLWRARNLFVHKLIRLTWKTECRKRILLQIVPEKKPLQSGNFTSVQIKQFLLRYSKMYPWVVKVQSYLNHFLKAILWIALLLSFWEEYEATLQSPFV